MLKIWRNRRWLTSAFSEIGCGLLTIMLFTLPLWVMTVGWRGPRYAISMILAMTAVVVLLAVATRLLRRRR